MRKGLVVGDFLPPHAGDHFVIDAARAQVDALTIGVRVVAGQPIGAALRERWLREAHRDLDVVALAAEDGDDWRLRASIDALPGEPPAAVFAAEIDGSREADGLRFDRGLLQRARELFPVTAARLREAPATSLDWVTPAVRAYLVRRVCVIGSESTGKTVLCERLAKRFAAPWVPEYGRDYTLAKLRTTMPDLWQPDEFLHIAREQQRREDACARAANGLVVCDTDAFATEIWLERYLGPRDLAGWPVRDRGMDRYLLTDPAVPFVADAIRDGEHLREWMFARFIEELDRRGFPYVVLRGSYAERERRAVAEIEALLDPDTGA